MTTATDLRALDHLDLLVLTAMLESLVSSDVLTDAERKHATRALEPLKLLCGALEKR